MLLLRRPLVRRAALGGGGVALVGVGFIGTEEEYRAIPEDSLPATYVPSGFSAVWGSHPRPALMRLATIATKSSPLMASLVGDWARLRVFATTPEPAAAREERHAQRARELRLLLTALGPTFIKFGQMLRYYTVVCRLS